MSLPGCWPIVRISGVVIPYPCHRLLGHFLELAKSWFLRLAFERHFKVELVLLRAQDFLKVNTAKERTRASNCDKELWKVFRTGSGNRPLSNDEVIKSLTVGKQSEQKYAVLVEILYMNLRKFLTRHIVPMAYDYGMNWCQCTLVMFWWIGRHSREGAVDEKIRKIEGGERESGEREGRLACFENLLS